MLPGQYGYEYEPDHDANDLPLWLTGAAVAVYAVLGAIIFNYTEDEDQWTLLSLYCFAI